MPVGWGSGSLEDGLADLHRRLPARTFVRCRFTCTLPDYRPGGHGLFGGLACFRHAGQKYREVRAKLDVMRRRETMTGLVQETYLRPQHERRSPGSGYRG